MRDFHILGRMSRLLIAVTVAFTLGGLGTGVANGGSPLTCPATGCGPVMFNSIKVYLIYWLPPGYVFDPNFGFDTGQLDGIGNWESLTQRFFNDISATSYFNIVTQYPGNCGSPPSPCVVQNVANAVTFGGAWVDSQPYTAFSANSSKPHTGTQSAPLQDSDIQSEVQRAVSQNHWSVDANSEFFVFTGVTFSTATMVEECLNSVSCTFKGTPTICAYHNFFSANNTLYLYAYMSDVQYNGGGKACTNNLTYAPNGQLSSDREVVTMTHEFFETVTDPLLSAWGRDSNEIGDKCNQQGIGPVYLNGNAYAVQQQWSNILFSSRKGLAGCAPQVPVAATCPVDQTDCSGELTITCNGPDVGIIFWGNCHDDPEYPGRCQAGPTGASTQSAGGTVDWIGSTTSPNIATVCTENANGENCINVSAPVPVCQGSYGPQAPQCPQGEKWCFRFTPPMCAPISECLVMRNIP
jgi:hypothetical protein